MKQDKVFVRYKNFNDNPSHNRDREYKKPLPNKKVYAEKSNRPREAIRQIIDSFEPLTEVPENMVRLIEAFPKFFSKESHHPEKDTNDHINDYVIYNAKKFIESLHHSKNHTAKEEHQSSSQPDWNSDDEIDPNMKSNKIDEAIVEKVVEKFGERLVKKQQILKRHEKEFLEDYFKVKRIQQQEQEKEEPKPVAKQQKAASNQTNKKIELEKNKANDYEKQNKKTDVVTKSVQKTPQNIWSEYQQKQVNNFVDMGFMTKVEDNEEEIGAEVVEDDGMFASDSDSNKQKQDEKEQVDVKSDQESEEDDIFGDDKPTSIKASYQTSLPRIQSEKKITQGTVFINHQIFSKIAEAVGLFPARCIWIIGNETSKFRVSTEYMDTIYRKQKMSDILPMISLNHSEFVKNMDVQTPQGLETFRKYNARREMNNNQKHTMRSKYQYKQKGSNHKKK